MTQDPNHPHSPIPNQPNDPQNPLPNHSPDLQPPYQNYPNQPSYSAPPAYLPQIKPFASGHSRALFTMLFFATGILLHLLSIGSEFMQINMLTDAASGRKITTEAANWNDSREALINLVVFLNYIATVICFLVWFHRAHRNLPALGANHLEFTPGWAVGGFFVPFLNLVRPYKVAVEIWKASSLEVGVADDISWEYAASSPLLGFWWGAWILSNILTQLAVRFSVGTKRIDDFIAITWLEIVADLASIVAAALAIVMIKIVDARQEEKHRLLQMKNLPPMATPQWGAPAPPQWGPPPAQG